MCTNDQTIQPLKTETITTACLLRCLRETTEKKYEVLRSWVCRHQVAISVGLSCIPKSICSLKELQLSTDRKKPVVIFCSWLEAEVLKGTAYDRYINFSSSIPDLASISSELNQDDLFGGRGSLGSRGWGRIFYGRWICGKSLLSRQKQKGAVFEWQERSGIQIWT